MGGSASTQIGTAGSIKAKQRSIDEERMVELLMPIYYTSVPLLQFEKDKAIKAWKLISGGLAPEFYRLKKNDPANVPCKTPMEFFGNQLVKRFISVHPVCQHMFSNTTLKQGTLFFRMISFVIATLEDEEKFDSHFAMLARTHNRMGVRAVEYGVFGEVLFFVLRLTLGDDYDAATHMGWVKIFSRMLKIIIPIVVAYELEHKPLLAQVTTKRISNMSSMKAVTTTCAHADEKTLHSNARMVSILPQSSTSTTPTSTTPTPTTPTSSGGCPCPH